MEHLVSGLVGGIVGGLIVLIGFWFVLRHHFGSNPETFLGFSVEATKTYRNVRVLDHEERSGGIWIQCQNEGDQLAEMPRFKLRLFEDDRLVVQHELCGDHVPPEQTTEQILSLRDSDNNPIGLKGLRYELEFVGAFCHPTPG